MDYVRLGTTGLNVSRLCLGTMTYGTPAWRPWVLDEETSRPFLKRAIEHGINFFDTSDMYSRGVSEQVVGRALKDFAKRDEIVLATKVFYPVEDHPNGRGLSRNLLLTHLGHLAGRGVRTIFLEVEENNQPARRLYEWAGFGVVGRRERYYQQAGGEQLNALLMRRDLS